MDDDNNMKLIGRGPVRSELFEDYQADLDKLEGDAQDLPYSGDTDPIKRDRVERSKSDASDIGLPSFQMGDPPEEVDNDLWEQSKKLPDDRQHNLWRAYRFGSDEVEQGDPRVRGQIFGTLDGIMGKAVYDVINQDNTQDTPIGALKHGAKRELFKGIDQYDPRKTGTSEQPAKLSTYAFGKLFPRGEKGPNKLNEVVRRLSDDKVISGRRYQRIRDFRNAVENFKQSMGREPSNKELADRMSDMTERDIEKMRFETADERERTEDTDETQSRSLKEKDAIRAVYHSMSGRQQKVMEKMFPGMLDGTAPESSINAGWNNEVAEELGVSASTISRDRSTIKSKINDLL